MTLTIELTPELEQQLKEEAARIGRGAAEYARQLLEERLTSARATKQAEAQMERHRRAIALLQKWSEEDAVNPDPDPVPIIPPQHERQKR